MSPAKTNPASVSVNEIASVRIELRHSKPLIWREVEVPTSITLKVLHDITQAVMGWFDSHLWEFTVGGNSYGLPVEEDWGSKPRFMASKERLRDVLKPGKTVIDYTYDFGDNWEHRLIITGVRAGQPGVSYPRYLGGQRNGPLEDCGGIPGFCELLDAIADPKHPGHAEAKQWADDYDPERNRRVAHKIRACSYRKPPQRREGTP